MKAHSRIVGEPPTNPENGIDVWTWAVARVFPSRTISRSWSSTRNKLRSRKAGPDIPRDIVHSGRELSHALVVTQTHVHRASAICEAKEGLAVDVPQSIKIRRLMPCEVRFAALPSFDSATA